MTRSAEHSRKLSEAMKGKKNALGCRRSAETRAKMSAARRRAYVPPTDAETLRDLYWERGLGKPAIADLLGSTVKIVETAMRFFGIPSDPRRRSPQTGPANPVWKGEDASYQAKHLRVASARGKPTKCEDCRTEDPDAKYEWANVSGAFDDPDDYVRLCVPCHRRFDVASYPRDSRGRFLPKEVV